MDRSAAYGFLRKPQEPRVGRTDSLDSSGISDQRHNENKVGDSRFGTEPW